MTLALETRALTKRYGDALALDGVDLEVEEGAVFGFLGPNGAGKTTALRIITGLARPTSGSVRILGGEASDAEVRRHVGFLPDVPAFYDWMTAPEFMAFAAELYGISRKTARGRADMLLATAGLAGVRTPIGGYSRGMKQRLGIAQALISAPRLLLLDEPTSALDPIGRKDVLDLIASLRGRTTVFFSTHILADVERVCDTIAILDHGRVITRGPIAELRARAGRPRIVLEVAERPDALLQVLAAQPWVEGDPEVRGLQIELAVSDADEAHRRLPGLIAESGVGLVRMDAGERTLEDVFVDLVGEHR